MNQPCPMIQDLLPLYVDQICSQESRRAVEETSGVYLWYNGRRTVPSAVPGWRSCAGKTRCPRQSRTGSSRRPGCWPG